MLKKFIQYYKPQMGLFLADMFCALIVAVWTCSTPPSPRTSSTTMCPIRTFGCC